MPDLAQRFPKNPLLRPADVVPSRDGLEVECLLNPGVFRFNGRIGLLLRVAERPHQEDGWRSTPIIDPLEPSGMAIMRVRTDDPELREGDPRVFQYRGQTYLTTLSHLRLAWSDDGGERFVVEPKPTLLGLGDLESFGIEDARVSLLDGRYYLTYTAVSPSGVAVGMTSTTDWQTFTRHGVILPPSNKDCALFPRRVNGEYLCLHRPSNVYIGGHYIWLARSPDLIHWGQHKVHRMVASGDVGLGARGRRRGTH